MTAPDTPEPRRWTDEAILEELRDARLEYVALLANRRGLSLDYAGERCRALAADGLVERTTDEVTVRITEEGERYLEEVAAEVSRGTGEGRTAARAED